MKRNDVHYLLKQLNSFSDIEEIEIVDMKQSKQQLQLQLQKHQQQQLQQRYQQHHQHQQQTQPQPLQTSSSLSPTHSHKQQQLHRRQRQRHQFASLSASGDGSILMTPQFDDYLFESSHYLETANTKNYCTAMIERSSSHEFRHLSINSRGSSSNSFHLNEMELPSVTCKAQPPSSLSFQTIPLQVETRLTTSGVQTELTAESLNKLSQSSSDSNGSDQRGLPFFRCCYTPIDRWRERRQQKSSTSTAATTSQKNDKNGCHPV
ncbi:alpha-protein kinase 1-like [Drosophila willistoni]|uniref:alpha-protein kinase 1-like n=1 Tax=Drosophila willistoni TaxID=7260 RepID=UPI001F07D3F9|nr:alpha-protein kinase 1-like [Drosophila willistoni]